MSEFIFQASKATIMGNNPFVNGKLHTGYFVPFCEDIAHMRKRKEYPLQERNLLIRRLAVLIFSSEWGNSLKALSKKAGIGETGVRDVLVRTRSPGLMIIEKILYAMGKKWEDLIGEKSNDALSEQAFRETINKAILQLTTEIRDSRKEKIPRKLKKNF